MDSGMTIRSSTFGGGAPIRRTEYTSGTGTFTPLANGKTARVTMIGGGGGGSGGAGATGLSGSAASGAGGNSGFAFFGEVVFNGPVTYVVGAGGAGGAGGVGTAGTAGTAGGTTAIGPYVAPGGGAGSTTTPANVTVADYSYPVALSARGGAGASGYSATFGGGVLGAINTPTPAGSVGGAFVQVTGGSGAVTSGGGGGNGFAFPGTGRGGNGGIAVVTPGGKNPGEAATGYGGGGGGGSGGGGAPGTGGAGGAGMGGYILIEEFA